MAGAKSVGTVGSWSARRAPRRPETLPSEIVGEVVRGGKAGRVLGAVPKRRVEAALGEALSGERV